MTVEEINILSKTVVDACFTVHRIMGPGLLESVYEECLCHELSMRGVQVSNQVIFPLNYRGISLRKEFRLDLLVENEIVIEIKSVEGLLPVHEAQIISYLKLTNKKLGFLVNFNVPRFASGIRRFVNGLAS